MKLGSFIPSVSFGFAFCIRHSKFCILHFALCITNALCIRLCRLFRKRRTLFAVGVLAPYEALCREARVKQSGITIIIYRPCVFRYRRMRDFLFLWRLSQKSKLLFSKMRVFALFGVVLA